MPVRLGNFYKVGTNALPSHCLSYNFYILQELFRRIKLILSRLLLHEGYLKEESATSNASPGEALHCLHEEIMR